VGGAVGSIGGERRTRFGDLGFGGAAPSTALRAQWPVDDEHQGSTRSSKHQGRGAHAAAVPEREEQRQREGSSAGEELTERQRGTSHERG